MARTDNLTNFLNDVATAIKSKLDDSTAIPASQFDTKIMSIETVGAYQSKTIPVTSNGSQTITPDQGYDALSSVVINTQVPIPQLQTKSYEFTDNATITLSPETGYDGFSSISLTINVSGGSINNQNKTITQNGSYTADQGYTGIGTATVNVPIANTSEYDSDLLLSQQILSGTGLPYIELEYIESTGTQYIDSGIYVTNVNKIESSAMFTDETDNAFFGARYSLSGDKLVIGVNYTLTEGKNYIQYGYGNKSWIRSTNYVPVNTYFDIIFQFDITGSIGTIITTTNTTTSYDVPSGSRASLYDLSDTPITLFGYNRPYLDDVFCGNVRIYDFKMYGYSGTLVRDFIPVKRKSDNEVCLYDRVTNTFFTNQGTDSFIAGPEIN